MASGVKPRVKVPKKVAAGDTITIKTLISHKMESGQRKDGDGNVIPRSIINRFTADFNGENVIDVTLEPAISTNPYLSSMPSCLNPVTSNSPGTTMTGMSTKKPSRSLSRKKSRVVREGIR